MWMEWSFLFVLVLVAGAGIFLGVKALSERDKTWELERQLWSYERLRDIGTALSKGLENDLGVSVKAVPEDDWMLRAENGVLVFQAEKTFRVNEDGRKMFNGHTVMYGPGFERRFRLVPAE